VPRQRVIRFSVVVAIVVGLLTDAGAFAAAAPPPAAPSAVASATPPEVSAAVHHDVSPPLRDLATNSQETGQHEVPNHQLPSGPSGNAPDPVIQPRLGAAAAPTPGTSWEGMGQGMPGFVVGYAPPDTNGDVGPNDYVQVVNVSIAVFNKAGALRLGPAPINSLWAGFPDGCGTNNNGDPTAVYDPIADRWVISQFSVSTLPYLQCVAVSTTADPTLTYNRYSFSYGNVAFPDYPKLGVWPDAYYETFNIFNNGTTFAGAKACAYDRANMLIGAAATQVCFNTSIPYGGLLPSDLDGSRLPPAGSPNYLVATNTSASLASWKFHVDFTTPANSTFIGPTSLPVAPYAIACGGGTCIPQAGTTQRLDSLADRLMYRLAYRNFGDHESLIVNHSVTAGSSAGVRWYELRATAGALSVYQQGTYAPDTNWRWMGSAAIDQAGNIALGYSVSGASLNPGIRYTGRLAGDPLGTMTQGEGTMISGTGSQTGGLSRWGDYSMLAVDPVDDCTFWYTTEYLTANGSFNWHTRVASFKLPGCPAGPPPTPDFSLSATPSSQTVTQGAGTSYTINITRTGGFSDPVTLTLSGLPAGAVGTFSPNATTGMSSTLAVTTTSLTPTGTYPLTISGTNVTLTRTTSASLVVTAPPPPDFSLSATPTSRTVARGAGTPYTVNIARTGGFTGDVTLSATGYPAGASGTFSPNPATTSSTLSVTTVGTTPPGTYSLTITGTNGTLSHTTSVTLVVTAPDFSLSATPTSRTVTRGANTTYTVNITRTGGFTGGITFTVSGLPSGSAGTFSPNPATGASSTLTVTTSATTTPAGTYSVTITGTSGSLTHTTSVTLVVTAGCTNGQCQN
jgi:hypothetical protein